jgi:hypothetical protein
VLGLSPGVELGAFEPDPLNDGVLLVLGGDLLEVSLTADPAFARPAATWPPEKGK